MTLSAATGVDRENPWPGLAPFTEEISQFFFGRDEDTRELLRLVKRETLTTLFGQSGLGKSSLLQAGLFPRLRQEGFLPIYLRLDHAPDAPALADQVKAALVKLVETGEIDAPQPALQTEQTLWEYFHSKDVDFWTKANELATPLLVFDQFEEIFTLGRSSDATRARGEEFLQQLSDLIENRMPISLRHRLDEGHSEVGAFSFNDPGCKIVLTLREDYLPELEGLRPRIRSVMQNRLRIRRMNGAQAHDVIVKAGRNLVEESVAPWIVHFVSAAGSASESAVAPSEHLEEMEVEPALLSIFCRELNNKRIRLGQKRISADLLSSSRQGILSDFYQRSIEDLPETVRIFVEDRLLTPSGIRDNIALENALLEPGVTRDVLERLVTRRLLRVEDRLGVQRVELTHDVLAQPIRASRDQRQHRVALAKSAEREQAVRDRLTQVRKRVVLYIAVAGFCISVPLVILALHQRSTAIAALHRAEVDRGKAMQQEANAETSAKQAVHYLELARKRLVDYYGLKIQAALKESPPASTVAEMLLKNAVDTSGFQHADLVRLLLPPAPFGPERSLRLGHPVSKLAYSPDGQILAALGDDRLWLVDARSGDIKEWPIPKELSSYQIKGITFQPWTKLLFIRLAAPEAGDLFIRWDYVEKAEQHPRYRLKWTTSASNKPAETTKLPKLVRGTLRRTLKGHESRVFSVALSRDGRTALSGSADGILKLWDLQTGQLILTRQGNNSSIRSVALSVDGRTALTGSEDSTLRLWNLQTGRQIRTFSGHASAASSVALSDDGRTALAGYMDGTLILSNVETGHKIYTLKGHTAAVYGVALTADGAIGLSGSDDKTLKLWNLKTGREMQTLHGHTDSVNSVAISPDGHTALSASDDETVRVWDLSAGREARVLRGHGTFVLSVALSLDGKTGLSGDLNNKMKVWDVQSGVETGNLDGHQSSIASVALSADGRTALSGSEDRTVKLWDLVPTSPPLPFTFHPDGKTLAAAGADGLLGLFNISREKPPASDPADLPVGPTTRPSVADVSEPRATMAPPEDSPLGNAVEFVAELFNPRMAMVGAIGLRTAPSSSRTQNAYTWDNLAYSRRGRVLISCAPEGIFYWDPSARTLMESDLGDVRFRSFGLAASPDGASFCEWSKATRHAALHRFVPSSHGENSDPGFGIDFDASPLSAAYSVDGRWVAFGMSDHGLQVYRPNQGAPVQILPQEGPIAAVAFRPDGLGFASASNANDGTILLWTASDREADPIRRSVSNQVLAAVSPGGRLVASIAGGRIRVCDRASGRELASYRDPASNILELDAKELALRDDGHLILAASDDKGLLRVWRIGEHTEEILVPEMATMKRHRLSDDGKWLAVSFSTGRVTIVEVAPGSTALDMQAAPATRGTTAPSVTVSTSLPASAPSEEDSSLFSSDDSSVQPIACMAFTHDGRILASYTESDRSLTFYQFAGHRKRQTLTVPGTAEIRCLEFSGDDKAVICGQDNGGLLCIESETGEKIIEVATPERPSHLSVSRDNSICVYDGPPRDAVFTRTAQPTAVDRLQQISGLYLDSHDNVVPLPAADAARAARDAALTPPSESMADFWSAWWECRRRRAEMSQEPSVAIVPTLLSNAFQPLKEFVELHPDAPSQYVDAARAALRDIEELRAFPIGADVTELLRRIPERQPVERILLLTELTGRLPDKSPHLSKVNAMLAFAYAERIQAINWPDSTIEQKKLQTSKAFAALRQAISLGYQDWPAIQSAFEDIKSDDRFPLEALTVEDLVSQADQLRRKNTRADAAEALRRLDLAFARGSNGYLAWYTKGEVLLRLDRPREAIPCFEAVIPLALPSTVWKAAAYRQLSACNRELGPRYLPAALKNASAAVEFSDSEKPSCLAERARVYFAMKDETRAMADLDNIVATAPNDTESWSWRGSVLSGLNRYKFSKDAADAFSKALDIGSATGAAPARMRYFREERAACNRMFGRYQEALADLDLLRKDDPENPSLTTQYAIIRAAQGYPLEAIGYFTKLIAIPPTADDEWLLARRGLARLEIGDAKGAQGDFKSALQSSSKVDKYLISDFLDLLCDEPLNLGQLVETQLKAAAADGVSADLNFARIKRRNGEDGEAIPLLENAVKITPTTAYELARRGIARAYLRQYDAALADVLKAAAEPEHNPLCQYACGVVYLLRTTAPATQPASGNDPQHQAGDAARALYYLGKATVAEDGEWYRLQHDWDLRAFSGDPTFAQLVAAQKLPDDKPDRAFQRARFFAKVYSRLRSSEATQDEIDLCLDAALSELERSKRLGLANDTLKAENELVEILQTSRLQKLRGTAPTTLPATEPVTR